MKSSFIPRLVAVACIVLAAGSASAGWREDIGTFRVGVLAGSDAAYRLATLEPFRGYLQDRIGIPVEIVPAATYDALIDAQASGQVQYAIYSATSYATALAKCDCVEAIAAPVANDGALGFYSIILARSGDVVSTLSDARGKRIALGPEDSVTGSLVPLHAFAAAHIEPRDLFAKVVITDTPEAAVTALLSGEVDLATAWSSLTGDARQGYDFGTLTRMVGDGKLTMDRVRIFWQSELIPFGPHAIRTDLPSELKEILSGAILSMASEDPEALDAVDRLGFGGGGFATPDPSLYTVVMDLVAPSASN